MKNGKKRTVALCLALLLTMGMTLTADAKSITGEYAGGTYTATLMLEPTYAIAALSYQTESPSDALYTLIRGTLTDILADAYIYNVSGYGGCYDLMDGFYVFGNGTYIIGTTQVNYLTASR